ncbi:MAG TPA: NAD-dependent epimerase/dehydratase family protein [Bryobacteraceae bacterium]|nr:NAD-dependent epimerase/dehydratase family protein [Bryobacteraceae bacterium]
MISGYIGKRVLITGGLGFLGSSLAVRLAAVGARVTVVDSLTPGCGGNRYNLASAPAAISVIEADIGDAVRVSAAIRDTEVIFNMAGEISHVHSMERPERDADLNAMAQLRFLEECTRVAPGVRVVYASTRQIYGVPQYLPVDEAHPVQPVDFNGVHKFSANAYHQLFTTAGKLDAVVLCLTNIYGPRMALNIPCQGFLGNFLRRSLLGQRIEVFGDGLQLRDPVYVDDAIHAFLLAGAQSDYRWRLFNVGGAEVLPLRGIAQSIARACGTPEPTFRPFPEDRKAIDIGSYATDTSRIRRELGWCPALNFEEGIRTTLEYFRQELPHYLGPDDLNPVCSLESPVRPSSRHVAV